MHMLKRLSTVTSMKQYLLVVFTLCEVPFQQVDSLCAYDRREGLDVFEYLVLGGEIVDVAFVLGV